MLVERELELDLVDALITGNVDSRAVLCRVEGPVASGKTAFLNSASQRAAKSGIMVLAAACSVKETSMQCGMLTQLFGGGALSSSFSDHIDRLVDHSESLQEGTSTAALRAFHGLYVALSQIARRTPVLIVIDDAQHSDNLSLQWLDYVARRSGGTRISILMSDGDGGRGHATYPSDILTLEPTHVISVRPLTVKGVAALMTRKLGHSYPSDVAAEVHLITGGNPLLVETLTDHFAATGQVVESDRFFEDFVRCIRRGVPNSLTVVAASALLGEHSSTERIAAVGETSIELARRVLRTLTASGILRSDRLRTQSEADAVVEQVPVEQLRHMNRRAAEILHTSGLGAVDIARCLIASGRTGMEEFPWAQKVLLKGAREALRVGDSRFAVQCLLFADSFASTPTESATTRIRLAEAEWVMNPAAGLVHIETLVRDGTYETLGVTDKYLLVRLLLWHGRTLGAKSVLRSLRAELRDEINGPAAGMHDVDAWLSWSHPALAQPRRSQAGSFVAVLRTDTDPWLKTAGVLATVLSSGMAADCADDAENILIDITRSRASGWVDEAAILAFAILDQAGRTTRVVELAAALKASDSDACNPVLRAIAISAHAQAALKHGDLAQAEDLAQDALAMLPPEGWGTTIGLPLATLIAAQSRSGKLIEAERSLHTLIPEALLQSRYGLIYLFARGHHRLATSHPHAALTDFLTCGDLSRQWGLERASSVAWRSSAAEAWHALDNTTEARRLAYEQLSKLTNEAPYARAAALRMSVAGAPPRRRVQVLNESLELFERWGFRYEQAVVLIELGKAQQDLHDLRSARRLFRRAWHLVDVCGARELHAKLLQLDSNSAPLEMSEWKPTVIHDLTESERRVASLAVLGYTNREIAKRLFITPSTVEQHLTRVFKKLHIKSRQNLPTELWSETTKIA